MYTPVDPSFPVLKWGVRGRTLHGHVFMMACVSHEELSHMASEQGKKLFIA